MAKRDEKTIKILEPGTEVSLVTNDAYRAVITAVTIRTGREKGQPYVTYEVAWWDKGRRECQWLEEHEICVGSDKRRRTIGFHNGG